MIRYSNIDSNSAVRWCFSNTRMKVNQTSSQHSIVATCPDLIAIFLNYYSMKIYTIYTSATMQVNLRTTQQLSRLIIIHCSCSIYLEVIRIKKSFQVANHQGPFQHDKANTEQKTCIINSGHGLCSNLKYLQAIIIFCCRGRYQIKTFNLFLFRFS